MNSGSWHKDWLQESTSRIWQMRGLSTSRAACLFTQCSHLNFFSRPQLLFGDISSLSILQDGLWHSFSEFKYCRRVGKVPVKWLDPRHITHTVCNVCPKRFIHMRTMSAVMTAKGRPAVDTFLPDSGLIRILVLQKGRWGLQECSSVLGRQQGSNVGQNKGKMARRGNKNQKKGGGRKERK
jgi:hypothetical protein